MDPQNSGCDLGIVGVVNSTTDNRSIVALIRIAAVRLSALRSEDMSTEPACLPNCFQAGKSQDHSEHIKPANRATCQGILNRKRLIARRQPDNFQTQSNIKSSN